jgi:putative transposase
MPKSGESHLYPSRLYHETPSWVGPGAPFHIRLRSVTAKSSCLTEESIALSLLSAAQNYHVRGRWYCHLVLLMPDHAHALLSFPRDEWMSRVVGEWKAYATRVLCVRWQPNFFDHRIRHGDEFGETIDYIRRNPVAKGLCGKPEDWPWVWSPT